MFRSADRMARALRQWEFWRMYARLAKHFDPPIAAIRGYTTGRGEFPATWIVRTPLGRIRLATDTVDDLITLGECFGKLDYRIPEDAEVVVDAGANVGFAAMYFLTHAPNCKVICIEPDPRNLRRLHGVIEDHGLQERIEVIPAAVGTQAGTAVLATEETGRYGFVRDADAESVVSQDDRYSTDIEVEMVPLGEVVRDVLSQYGRISLLKLDIEGLEVPTLQSLTNAELSHIDIIYAETDDNSLVLEGFEPGRQGGIRSWRRKSDA
jgi:FkbM family methyltransferase